MIKLTEIAKDSVKLGNMNIQLGQVVSNPFAKAFKSESESVNEASLTVSIANVVRDLLPKEVFYAYKPEDTERVKAVISDLVKRLNQFYKTHNIKTKFVDSNLKFKMYSKEHNEIIESAMIKLKEILENKPQNTNILTNEDKAVKGGDSAAGKLSLTKILGEANETYFKSFTHAAEAARAYALKKGYDIDENDWQSQVAMGGKYSRSRPGVGKTHSFSVGLLRNGKPQRKGLNFSVYGMESGNFELTTYIN